LIYLSCFALSAGLAYFAQKSRDRWGMLLLSLLSIAFPVVLAGLRDITIGIDVKNYLNFPEYWAGAIKERSLLEYLKDYAAYGHGEPLFGLYLGIIARTTGNYRTFLFLSHLVIVTGVYIGAFRMREHAPPALTLLLFYLFFYNQSLNVIRQYMAMAIVFAALRDVTERKYLRYCIVVGVSALIHTSALLALGYLVIWWGVFGEFGRLNLSLSRRKFLIPAGILLVAVGFVPLCQLLIRLGLLGEKYSYYFTAEKSPALIVFTLVAAELFLLWIFRHQLLKRKSSSMLVVASVAYWFLLILSWTVAYGRRISAYFSFSNLLTIGMLQRSFREPVNRKTALCIAVLIAAAYWIYTYGVTRVAETVPYLLGVAAFG